MAIGLTVIVAIWAPILWPVVTSVLIYLVRRKALKRPEHYWTVSLVFGYCAILLAIWASALLQGFIAGAVGKSSGLIGVFALLLVYGTPLSLSVYAAIASS